MDEFCRNQYHQMNRCSGTGSIRLASDKPTQRRRCNLQHWWEKIKWHRMIRQYQFEASEQSQEKVPESMSSVLKRSLQHRMIRRAPKHCVGTMTSVASRRCLQHRMIRCQPIGLSGGSYVTCQKTQRLPQGAEWPDDPVPYRRSIRRHAESWVTTLSTWWPIYMDSPGHLKIAGVATSLKHWSVAS